VGRALAASGIPRDELFITTKLWNSDQGFESTIAAHEASLAALGLDHVDLYLIHWPAPANDLYLETWRAMEQLLADNRVRAIGVSNFEPEHLERLVDASLIVPAVNQVELHPRLTQSRVRAANDAHGIRTEAWSPLAQGSLLADPVIVEIAGRSDRTPAQVVLRWHLQQGRIVIPKSVTPSRIAENLAVFDFDLSADDLRRIDALNTDSRIGPDPVEFAG
jgi:2,5-diketo-D-gluconate reductase A